MEKYRTSSHSRYDLKYHFVWVTKYRKPILVDAVGQRLRDLVREICRTNEIEILEGRLPEVRTYPNDDEPVTRESLETVIRGTIAELRAETPDVDIPSPQTRQQRDFVRRWKSRCNEP